MFRDTTPLTLLYGQADVLLRALPPVKDGAVEGVHDARVATRRIRELLPLTAEWHRADTLADLHSTFRTIGRALGAVRDADVQSLLMGYFEARIPSAAPTLVVVRHGKLRQRQLLMRGLIKECERLDLERLLASLPAEFSRYRSRPWIATPAPWRQRLKRTIADRAAEARDAIAHATGVYFPNRAHGTRIALKKFRYAAEIASATGAWPDATPVIRELKKGQDVLGDLHDRQELIDRLPAETPSDGPQIDPAQVHLISQVVEAEVADLHRRYLGRRQTLNSVCDMAHREFENPHRRVVPAITAGAVALTSAAYLMRGSRAR